MEELKNVLKQYFRESAEQSIFPELITEKLNNEQIDKFNQLLDNGVDALVEVDANLSQIGYAVGTLGQVIQKISENEFSIFELQSSTPKPFEVTEDSQFMESSFPADLLIPFRCQYWPFCFKNL